MSCFVLSMLKHVDAGRPKYFLSVLYIMRDLIYVDIYIYHACFFLISSLLPCYYNI
jgi:hypothetical protein